MKKLLTTLCAVVFISCFSQVSKAGTYYVVNGQSFSLSPDAGTPFYQYLWTLDPGAGQVSETLDQASGGVLTHTFSDAVTSPSIHKITLGVIEVLDGCLSNVVEHTVIVLPKLTVSITADKENFCTDKTVAATLSATVSATTGLDTYGVTVSPFVWSKGASVISGQTGSTLNVTEAATYSALVNYILPSTGDFIPTASKLAGSVIGGTREILHNLPVPTVPAITLN